ncbi:MAG: metalloprotease [Halobacteriaceae archaeon]
MRLSGRELRDLLVAWLALGVAFTFFFERGLTRGPPDPAVFASALALNLVTVGVAFLGHELAHKTVAVRFGQRAEFRADFGMLFLAVMGGLVGFIFAAPGAVHHRGYLTDRQHGLIALAGPVSNLAMAPVFLLAIVVAPELALRGVGINLLLAGFNMIPFGGLDGATVREWSTAVFVAAFVPSVLLAVGVLVLGVGF